MTELEDAEALTDSQLVTAVGEAFSFWKEQSGNDDASVTEDSDDPVSASCEFIMQQCILSTADWFAGSSFALLIPGSSVGKSPCVLA